MSEEKRRWVSEEGRRGHARLGDLRIEHDVMRMAMFVAHDQWAPLAAKILAHMQWNVRRDRQILELMMPEVARVVAASFGVRRPMAEVSR